MGTSLSEQPLAGDPVPDLASGFGAPKAPKIAVQFRHGSGASFRCVATKPFLQIQFSRPPIDAAIAVRKRPRAMSGEAESSFQCLRGDMFVSLNVAYIRTTRTGLRRANYAPSSMGHRRLEHYDAVR